MNAKLTHPYLFILNKPRKSWSRFLFSNISLSFNYIHVQPNILKKIFRSYSYYIEVSMDQKDWVRVVDYSKYYCRSWQELYFTPKVARYIRIFGTYNTLNKVFHVVSLEAYYTKKPYHVDKHGILSKLFNMYSLQGFKRF